MSKTSMFPICLFWSSIFMFGNPKEANWNTKSEIVNIEVLDIRILFSIALTIRHTNWKFQFVTIHSSVQSTYMTPKINLRIAKSFVNVRCKMHQIYLRTFQGCFFSWMQNNEMPRLIHLTKETKRNGKKMMKTDELVNARKAYARRQNILGGFQPQNKRGNLDT